MAVVISPADYWADMKNNKPRKRVEKYAERLKKRFIKIKQYQPHLHEHLQLFDPA
jgi:hypothetical protein